MHVGLIHELRRRVLNNFLLFYNQGKKQGVWFMDLGFEFLVCGRRTPSGLGVSTEEKQSHRLSRVNLRLIRLGRAANMVLLSRRPGGNAGANRWCLYSALMQMPPRRGGICGRWT